MNTSDLPPLVVIAGPTASGKSALAMAVADLTPAVIVNADAMQVYRDLRVVTARPSEADMARHPHALFGHVDGAVASSAADWARAAAATIAAAHAANRLPVLVGGSGLYIRTLLDGIADVPAIDPAVRERVRALPVAAAHARLAIVDPAMAARLNAGDTTRVARALEVVEATGVSLAVWQRRRTGGLAATVRLVPLVLTPDPKNLALRIDGRLDAMIDDGRDEVRALIDRGLDRDLPVMRAIGVREIAAHLDGTMTRQTARDAIALATRQYAKRQRTWFAKQAPADWPRSPQNNRSVSADELATLLCAHP